VEEAYVQDCYDSIPEGLGGPTKVKPWTEPPLKPDPRSCVAYIQSLNPRNDAEDPAVLTKKWLSAVDIYPQVSISVSATDII